jgi:uncharacterized protein (TIGR02996 family)
VSDRDALLRAICENPDDDAPRLIYADWLDEHGDPRQAEFVRVQVELARLLPADRPGHPLAAREQALWRDLRKWRYVLGDWLSLYIQTFERGFNAQWAGTVPDFLKAAPDFWRKGPIRTLALDFPQFTPPGSAHDLAIAPYFRRMRTVRLRGFGLTDEWIADLVRPPFAAEWARLEILGDEVTDRACQALTASTLPESGCILTLNARHVTAAGHARLEAAFDYYQPADGL